MKTVLVLFTHPRLEKSRVNIVLLRSIAGLDGVTVHDLYEEYPDFAIDVRREKELLLGHDIIVWHHPFFWYSAPPLLKAWIDTVLEVGWAYGPGGTALTGKVVFNCLTSGGPREAYGADGRNRFTVREFLAPFEQTARLCHMLYLPPFVVQGTHRLSPEAIESHGRDYSALLRGLANEDLHPASLESLEALNDAVTQSRIHGGAS
jgi:glutathione-regulated potassium-efflux system ancillary protein KefG